MGGMGIEVMGMETEFRSYAQNHLRQSPVMEHWGGWLWWGGTRSKRLVHSLQVIGVALCDYLHDTDTMPCNTDM